MYGFYESSDWPPLVVPPLPWRLKSRNICVKKIIVLKYFKDLLILFLLYSHLTVSQRQFMMTTGLTPMLWHILRLLALIWASVKTLVRYLLLVWNRQGVQCLVCILDWNAWVSRSHDEVATHSLWRRGLRSTIDRSKVLLVLLLRLRRMNDALVGWLVLHSRVVIHRTDLLVEVVSLNS